MDKFDLGTAPTKDTIKKVASYLEKCTGYNEGFNAQALCPEKHVQETSLTLFHARTIPTIHLFYYLSRILKYCPCQNEVFISLVIHFRNIISKCRRKGIAFNIDAYSVHRLIIVGVTVASKWFSDMFFTNTRYARVGGLPVDELNSLEVLFLSLLDFKITIPISELQRVGEEIFEDRHPDISMIPAFHISPQGIYIPAYYAPPMPQTAVLTPQSAFFEQRPPISARARRLSYPGTTKFGHITNDPYHQPQLQQQQPVWPSSQNINTFAAPFAGSKPPSATTSARTLHDSPCATNMSPNVKDGAGFPKSTESSGLDSPNHPVTPCNEFSSSSGDSTQKQHYNGFSHHQQQQPQPHSQQQQQPFIPA
ncbi:cyclin-like protein interacting with PHO85 [Mycoemilia scoparia]|uniref:Cyclin-like protein interacting with PHO85 n=1 Tax=Mycoemilia scoparia TaxID=417184 RepID=A0A9W8DVV0_9FUNG|nr:cyclin-like protein interacting with PHO85 [Mycoemilia scoparia]